ncbi:MAG: cytidine deaminase [Lachnospiraceae bacterium]|nr:cytidine deaminase [Lachnospiraceae bacterium]
MNENIIKELIVKAFDARKNAYAPFSNFYVGAALLCKDGSIYKGCNVENSAYPVGLCAERNAFPSALCEGKTEFEAIAIVGGNKDEKEFDFCPPCGMCRQFMREFVEPSEFKIILAKSEDDYIVKTLEDLLPMSFKF